MKISKLFHWLYFILMMLPLFGVVSTFAYYSFNKNASVPTVTETISKEVDFNQLFEFDGGTRSDVVITNNDGLLEFNGISTSSWFLFSNYYLPVNDFYVLKLTVVSNPNNLSFSVSDLNYATLGVSPLNPIVRAQSLRESPRPFGIENFDVGTDFTGLKFYFNIFNLTQMFGAGNEPTLDQFNTWFSNDYYEHTTSEHIVIENYSTQEVSDSAINHFWLPSFGGLSYVIQNVYLTLVGSLFGFSIASGVGYVVVELLTYWTAVSIIYLVFDLFMYLPLLVHRWVDKARLE